MLQLTPSTSVDSFTTATSTMQDTYPGIYRLECTSSSLCADLSGKDFRTVIGEILFSVQTGELKGLIGFGVHDGDNQQVSMTTHAKTIAEGGQWELTALGAGFAIRSVYNGAYLSIDLGSERKNIVGTMFPVSWDIRGLDSKQSGLYRYASRCAETFALTKSPEFGGQRRNMY